LAASVVGSGIMATNLTKDPGLQLLINSFATFLILAVLIQTFAPLSGAHFNPAVTLVNLIHKDISVVNAVITSSLK